jgi:serine/threonine protein kinase
MSLEPGSTFGRFEVLEQIGSGGMGAVYRARDPRLGRQVALKVLHAQDEQARADVLHEARAAARIDHPNAVQVFDADEVDGVPYIAMELIQGTSLRAMIGREGISIETKVAWLLGIARALAAAHAKGIVHRDLKPENVMIREDGIVKVLDFGIAARMPEVDRSAETGTLEEGGPGGGGGGGHEREGDGRVLRAGAAEGRED